MKKTKLSNKQFLVYSLNSMDGYAGINAFIFAFDNEKSGLDKLNNFIIKNDYRANYCYYEMFDMKKREVYTFNSTREFENYLNAVIKRNKEEIIKKYSPNE